MNIIDDMNDMQKRLKAIELMLGIKKEYAAPTTTKVAPPQGRHADYIQQILSDGIPKSISKITAEVSRMAGKKQKKSSLNVMCSKLYRCGILSRPETGVYQKAA